MHPYQFLLLSIFFSSPLVAETSFAKGIFSVDGDSVQINNAYLQTDKNPLQESQNSYLLTLSDATITSEMLRKPLQLAFVDNIHYIQIQFNSEQNVYSVIMHHPKTWDGGHMSGGRTPYKLELNKFTGDLAEGRAYLKEKSCFGRDENLCQYDISFKASLLPDIKVTGEPLPEGGGEPGLAYRAFLKASADGDVNAYRKYLTAEGSASFTDTEFIAGLPMFQAMTPSNVKILGGRMTGDSAILKITGLESGQENNGIITMKKIAKGWVYVSEEWEPIIIK